MAKAGKTKALETTLATIQKRYGEGAIMRLGQASHLHVESIPTGSLALDLAFGVGGVPRGRVTEIYWPEGSGKTTVAQHGKSPSHHSDPPFPLGHTKPRSFKSCTFAPFGRISSLFM